MRSEAIAYARPDLRLVATFCAAVLVAAMFPVVARAEGRAPSELPTPVVGRAGESGGSGSADTPVVGSLDQVQTEDAGGGVQVQVTARVAESFSLTVRTTGGYSFGEKTLGKRYASPRLPILRVTSSRPWLLTDTSDNLVATASGQVYTRSRIIRHVTWPRLNRVLRPGAYEVVARYWLDLTDRSLENLPAGSVITAAMGYTVVQR